METEARARLKILEKRFNRILRLKYTYRSVPKIRARLMDLEQRLFAEYYKLKEQDLEKAN